MAVLFVAACMAGWAWLRGCEGRPRPHVLLVTVDTLRADRLGCYGYGAAATPVLDGLAREGVLFERCYAQAPVTRPSHATILTGLAPYAHGVRDNLFLALAPGVPTLAEVLSGEGYRTGAVVSAEPLVSASGLSRGFDDYDDDLPAPAEGVRSHFRERRAVETTDRALAWLARAGEGPFFLWVHYFDPHADYDPPEPFRSGHPYDGEVAYVDRELGRLLARIEETGAAERAIVVFTADHGEGLGEHGEATHAYFVHDSTLRVPLVIRAPGRLPAGQRVEPPVGLVDLFSTILALAGVEERPDVEGRSLVPLARGEGGEGGGERPPPVYGETYEPLARFGWRPLVTLREGPWKAVAGGPTERELYRTDQDPGELKDLLAGASPEDLDPDAHTVLRRLLDDLEDRRGRMPRRPAEVSREAGARGDDFLDTIPYSGLFAGESGRTPPSDPAAFVERTNHALDLAAGGRLAMSLSEVRGLLSLDPQNPYLFLLSGKLFDESGRPDEALAAYQELRRIRPADIQAARACVDLLLRLGRYDEASKLCEELLKSRKGDAFLWRSLAFAELSLGHHAQSASAARQALEIEPGSAPARIYLARALLGQGEFEEPARIASSLARAGAEPAGVVQELVEEIVQEGERTADPIRLSLLAELFPEHPRRAHWR
ncbi:MAG: sulfatase-like hydrolase/transferase [Planctomycetes bacterium]|nr:sulfatase-like hydrolase/transferase [Planctomycetota bacterium]